LWYSEEDIDLCKVNDTGDSPDPGKLTKTLPRLSGSAVLQAWKVADELSSCCDLFAKDAMLVRQFLGTIWLHWPTRANLRNRRPLISLAT